MLNTSNDQRKLLPNFQQLFATTAQAPGGVARLRELILTLAVQGKLVAQDASDEPASELLKKIRAEKERLIAEGKIKKDKPLPAITEDEKPFELPVGWEWVRLNNLTPWGLIDGDWIESKDQDPNGSIRLVQLADVGDGFFKDKSDKYINQETFERLSCNQIVSGDVLIARLPNPIGRSCVFPGLLNKSITVVDVAICRLSGFIPNDYLVNAINSGFVRERIESFGKGATRFRVSTGNLKSLLLPLPPLAEQSRIVARVEALMRLCDALEEKGRLEHTQHQQLLQAMLDSLTQTTNAHELARHWQRLAQHFDLLIDRPEAVDALEQTILQLAVRGLLVPQDPSDEPASELLKKIRAEKDRLIAEGKIKKDKPLPEVGVDENSFELPMGWQTERLGNILNISSGITLGRKTAINNPIEVPYLRVANVQRWRLELTSMKSIIIDETEVDKYKLLQGDLLITEGGDWDKVGRTAIWNDDLPFCAHQNHVFKARKVSAEWNVIWSELYLNSDIARTYFASSAKQTTKEPLHKSPTHVLAHACRVRQHPGLCSNLILA